ncbi:MAG TPA: nodulation protein NfeD [Alphaproteobacteria bacterium]|nr:nodulation protein NfeD [Alphaproteobacteria bacterium]
MARHLSRLARIAIAGLAVAFSALAAAQPPASEGGEGRLGLVAEIDGAIGPATADYLADVFETAEARRADLVILRMDTPGGLVDSMRIIIRAILASDIPVVTYVAPPGARAASAGTYILYASHVAAMAPGTNLGAATPVQLGGPPPNEPAPEEEGSDTAPEDPMSAKSVNDAAAYIRSLAELRGRNADWAERAVREAASLAAHEALEQDVIDLVAGDLGEVLARIDGMTVTFGDREAALETTGLVTERIEPDWRIRVLSVLTNPNVVLILMMIGVYGLIFEFANPGAVVPGVVGAIAIVLGLYALSILPLNYTGLALLGLGVAFMVGEAFVPSFGVLGIGGAVAFAFGASLLFDGNVPGLRIAWPVIAGATAVSAGFLVFVLGAAWRAHRRPVTTGTEGLRSNRGEVLDWSGDTGTVRVAGERWQATGGAGLIAGQTVRVLDRRGLTLVVEPVDLPQKGDQP